MVIYEIANSINDRKYVGKTKNNRDSYYGSGILIIAAIKKYGRENFKKEIIEYCKSIDELNEKEIYWIKELNTLVPNGYNIGTGGEGGDTFTNHPNKEEYRKNKSIASKKLWKNKDYREHLIRTKIGTKRTEESKKRISEANKNKPKSASHRKALSKAWEKRKIEKPHTEETRRKRSESMKGKNVGKYIQIHEFLSPDGKIYKTEEGIVKFCKSIHKHPNEFKKLVEGKRSEYGGWTYVKTIKNG